MDLKGSRTYMLLEIKQFLLVVLENLKKNFLWPLDEMKARVEEAAEFILFYYYYFILFF